jgi:hypothetical protein
MRRWLSRQHHAKGGQAADSTYVVANLPVGAVFKTCGKAQMRRLSYRLNQGFSHAPGYACYCHSNHVSIRCSLVVVPSVIALALSD